MMEVMQLNDAYFRERFPERKKDTHKGDFGKVLIFAGSRGMAGAATLTGRATLRCGAGLVRYMLPSFEDPIYPILQTNVPEATCITPEKIGFYGTKEAEEQLSEYTAVAAGSGLGADVARQGILEFLIRHYNRKLILDADALNAIASGRISRETLLQSNAEIILTPHVGEAKRLIAALEDKSLQKRSGNIRSEEERLFAVTILAEAYHSTVLLKGAGTLIASPSGTVLQNTTGGPGMATGGSGDVLTGIIAAFAAQGLSPVEAAACGAYLHGKSGDLAADALGEACMNASDIIQYLPEAWPPQ